MKIIYKNVPAAFQSIIKNTIREFFLSEKIEPRAIVNVEFVNEKAMRDLNKRYRHIDAPTDVLSFPIFKNLSQIPKESPFLLGDIIICPEKTDINHKLTNLVKHSLNHLVGRHH